MNCQPRDLHSTSSVAVVRFARIFSDVFSPPVIFAVLGFSIAWVDAPFWPGLAWALVYGFLICLVPIGVVLYLLKTGQIGDLHMRDKGERHIPYLVGFICAVVALVVVNVFGGSQLLRSLIICNIAGLAALGFINIYWLISNHTASIMLATLFVGFTFGVTASIALMPLVGLVFWARFLLRRHTVAQLIAGLFVGAAPVLILANFGYIN